MRGCAHGEAERRRRAPATGSSGLSLGLSRLGGRAVPVRLALLLRRPLARVPGVLRGTEPEGKSGPAPLTQASGGTSRRGP